jgi:hypothetical protein
VLTGPQIGEMFFATQPRARVRLAELHRRDFVARFQPYRDGGGAEPYHYVLGREGAAVVAADAGEDPDRAARRWDGERALALARSQRRAHLCGINGFYACLVGATRRGEGLLEDWLTEGEAARWGNALVRPDAWGCWREGLEEVEFFLEWDRGTETLGRLVDKLVGYERTEAERGVSAWVLFAFLTPGREAAARAAFAEATVPIATGVVSGLARPHEALWSPVGRRAGRMRLASLGRVPKPTEAVRRAADGGSRAWYYDRSREIRSEAGQVEPTAPLQWPPDDDKGDHEDER